MSKFLKLEVLKQSATDVYIEVPDDFDITRHLPRELLKKAVVETTHPSDWDDSGSENHIEINGRTFVEDKEGKAYKHLTLDQVTPFIKV